ncbi:DUF4349 domain-containing protein [Chloroflexota bacterium]
MKRLVMITGMLLVVVLPLLVACSAAKVAEEGYAVETERAVPAPPPGIRVGSVPSPAPAPEIWVDESNMSRAGAPPVVIAPKEMGVAASQQSAIDRMIVRTGDVALVVEGVPVAIDQITNMADGFEGYVVSSNVWKEGERLVGSITIRVAAEHFDDAMRALRGLAVDVTSESSTSRDVTEEYVDLSAKLQNLEATEAQLLRIMEKTETVEDILNVQRELSRTRDEIERTKARMQYLERTSATSLIQVRLEQSTLDIEFTADKRRGLKEGEKVRFTVRQIAGGFAPYSYEWDFGDGDISTDENPTHSYKTAGSYTVSLRVTDDRGNTDIETRDGYIIVFPGWNAGSIASGAWNGLVTFGHVLANVFIWIGVFSPVWVVIGGILYYYRRRRRRKQTQ